MRSTEAGEAMPPPGTRSQKQSGKPDCCPSSHASQATPDYDLAWYQPDGRFVVAEVKSLTSDNEAQQLRLGLGQLLDYRHALVRRAREVSAVLAVERRPASARWRMICQANGVKLVWPTTMHRLFRPQTAEPGRQ